MLLKILPIRLLKRVSLAFGLMYCLVSGPANTQDASELEACILRAASVFNTYRECASQVVAYHAAKVRHPEVTISFAQRSCGADRDQYLSILSKCMGRDVANSMLESEEAQNLLPHLHELIQNAGQQKVHGDLSPPAPDDPFHTPMKFRILGPANETGEILLEAHGRIEKSTADQFRAFLADKEIKAGQATIRLNSPGGLMGQAMALGHEIRRLKFSTEVEHNNNTRPQCLSACVYVFLGGIKRHARAGHLGVHRFYRDLALSAPERKAFDSRDLAAVQLLSARLAEYVTQMGVNPALVTRAAKTPENEISFLTEEELVSLKVVPNLQN